MNTTIAVNKELKKELDKLKIHPREPCQEVIKRMIKEVKK